ncbi:MULTISPECIES: efflux RND transporter periplasmic adaptor subunit [Methylomonas]|uniref:Efflux transporter periplasmic adaptor subunit n=1 Tax=Methylomonas koyamae TaxID=702114 RepID=A0A177NX75_9GAMM|nr:efflux RND transporter periplasmic adaptor subunit [Methylomonas koyamae]OAI22442.1 efflux transporter periplasmic adaptor subunit [Methylomonas koyamae]
MTTVFKRHFNVPIRTALLAGLLALAACNEAADKTPPPPAAKTPGEVVLQADSPKKTYVKIREVAYSRPPTMEPLAGKIAYDENLTSRISSPVAGRVVGQALALGSQVAAGSTLLELHSPDVADAEADFAKAQAESTLANRAYQRQRELYEGKVVARKDFEQAEDDLQRARSELQRTETRLKNLHLAGRQANGRFALKSPLAGSVVERNVNPGQEVGPDTDRPLFVVSDLSRLSAVLEVFEIHLSKIKVGQQVSVEVPAYPGERFPAVVRYIGQLLDENSRSVQVRCELANPDGRLLPGMYASVTLESDPSQQAIVIPLTAVFTEAESDYVFVATGENRFKQKPIKIGLRLKDQGVVLEGLQPGERLVTEGALVLRAEEDADTQAN